MIRWCFPLTLSFFCVFSLEFNGTYVVSGSYDCTVRVWDVESGRCMHELSGHTNRVYSLQVSCLAQFLFLVRSLGWVRVLLLSFLFVVPLGTVL